MINPDNGTVPSSFSASINFVGNSLWLRSPNGEPFIAAYVVVADLFQPKGVFVVTDASLSQSNSTSSDE